MYNKVCCICGAPNTSQTDPECLACSIGIGPSRNPTIPCVKCGKPSVPTWNQCIECLVANINKGNTECDPDDEKYEEIPTRKVRQFTQVTPICGKCGGDKVHVEIDLYHYAYEDYGCNYGVENVQFHCDTCKDYGYILRW